MERSEADEVLDAAVQLWAEVYELVDDGDVITEYVIGLAAQNPGNEQAGMTRYAWGSRHDAMPIHHVLGLLSITRDGAGDSFNEDGDGG